MLYQGKLAQIRKKQFCSKVRLCSLQWAPGPPWVSRSGHQETEVRTNLEDTHLISQIVHSAPEEGTQSPQRLQVALHSMYSGSQHMHKCPYCPYTSRLSSNVKRHVRTHTGEMPYSCPQCDFRCKDASSMKRHQATHARHALAPVIDPTNSSTQI